MTSILYFAQNALHQLSKEFTLVSQIMKKKLQLLNYDVFSTWLQHSVCFFHSNIDCIFLLLLARGVLGTLSNMKVKVVNYFLKTLDPKYLSGIQIHKYESAMLFLYFPASIYLPIVLVPLFLTLNIFCSLLYCFYC